MKNRKNETISPGGAGVMKSLIAVSLSVCICAGLVSCGGTGNKETVTLTTAQSATTGLSAESARQDSQSESQVQTTEAVQSLYGNSEQFGALVLADSDSIIGGTYTATGTDESVMEISGTAKASVASSVLKKTDGGASGADDASFTGLNAAVRVYDSAELELTDCEIDSTAENATGVFAYDNGVVRISDSVINVTGGGAGGVQVAGGGTLIGSNLTVTSSSKAAIRSDRGGGMMTLVGGTYTSTGTNGCPAIYSTADISVADAVCISENSRAVIIEGKNSVSLSDCTLTGNDQSTKEGSIKANVLLYQSASGDAENGVSVFTMEDGSMECLSGAMFCCTNTSSVINLNNAELKLSTDESLLIVSAGRWGKDGSNGGNCTLNAENQTLEGSITVDEISSLAMNLTSSDFTGYISGDGDVTVSLDGSSTWTLTGDSYISSFSGDIESVNLNGYTLYVNGEAYAA